MSSNIKQDPIAVARMILEGKGKNSDEGLKKALKSAIEEDKEEFDYEGKTYKVSDFSEDIDEANAEDITGKLGGENVPAPDVKDAEKLNAFGIS